MIQTNFDSYCLNGVALGCEYCVEGEKLVLFITGKCSRKCKYCSLSEKRKNKDIIWANERECKKIKDAIEEAQESNAKGAGITGGDPLVVLKRTIEYSKALKKKFGKNFHIHIYLPTKLVSEKNLNELKKAGIDEVRFHPDFLKSNPKNIKLEVNKIKLAQKFWPINSIGIEIPIFPGKIEETVEIINRVEPFIGFVNLNELEISDTNFKFITKNYNVNEDSYTIKGSKGAGLLVLEYFEKKKSKLKIHLCTARTKNLFQYKNRLKLRKILRFGYKTAEGTVKYFAINFDDIKIAEFKEFGKKFKKEIFLDFRKKRIILSEKLANKLQGKYKINKVEEMPTYDSTQIESEEI